MVNNLYIVALTGGIGSGKTAASNMFAEHGVPIVDLDAISRQLTANNMPLVDQIGATLGTECVIAEGVLDRAKVRQLIFNNEGARKQLNFIMHPAIREEAFKQLSLLRNEQYAILSIPLLEPNNLYASVIDRILTIDCDEKTQIERVKIRSQLSETEIKQIISTQIPRQVRLSMSDDIIENNGNTEELRKKVKNLHHKYIKNTLKLA